MLATLMLSTRYTLMDRQNLTINFAKLSLLHNKKQLRQFIPLHGPKATPGSPPKLPPAHTLGTKKLPSSTLLVITQQALEQATTKPGLRAPAQPSPPPPPPPLPQPKKSTNVIAPTNTTLPQSFPFRKIQSTAITSWNNSIHSSMNFDWEHYQDFMRHEFIFCKGFTTIRCATLITNIGKPMKKAFFCFADKLFEWAPKSAIKFGIKYFAFCKIQPNPLGKKYFDDMNYKMMGPPLIIVDKKDAQLTKPALTVKIHPITGIEKTSVTIEGKIHLASPTLKEHLTYVVFGDCNYGNPGHCMGDWYNFYIVRQLLGHTKEQTRVVLYRGFGGHAYHAQANSIKMKNVLKLKLKRGDPTPMVSSEHSHFFLPEWESMADHVYDSKTDVIDSFMYPLRLLKTVAFSPSGSWSPHWKLKKTYSEPNKIMKEMAVITRRSLLEKMHYSVDQPGVCDWLKSVLHTHESNELIDYNQDKCRIALTNDGQFKSSNIILYIRRVKERRLSNRQFLLRTIQKSFSNFTILDVNQGELSWPTQGILNMIARVIVGMHGGGLWNAARYVQPGQTLLEVMPILGPGTTEWIARSQGIEYKSIVCKTCVKNTKHIGALEPEKMIGALENILGIKRATLSHPLYQQNTDQNTNHNKHQNKKEKENRRNKFVIVAPWGGLGNCILPIISAWYLANFTGRKLLIENKYGTNPTHELAELFENTKDLSFYNNADAQKLRNNKTNVITYNIHRGDDICQQSVETLLCEDLQKIQQPIIQISSTQYFAPLLFQNVKLLTSTQEDHRQLPFSILRPSKFVVAKMKQLRNTQGLVAHEFVAAHVRAKDWFVPSSTQLQAIFDCLLSIAITSDGKRMPIYVASDDSRVLEQAKTQLGALVNLEKGREDQQNKLAAFAEALLLSSASNLLTTPGSTFSYTARALGSAKIWHTTPQGKCIPVNENVREPCFHFLNKCKVTNAKCFDSEKMYFQEFQNSIINASNKDANDNADKGPTC